MFQVLVSGTFQKQFDDIPKQFQENIRKGLKELGNDPYEPRSGADIKSVEGTNPQKYRMRVGEYRIVYRIEGKVVKVIEVFPRGRGYRNLI